MSAELVERLRSSARMQMCPYDRRSPEYLTTPDDEPCKFCGQLNDPDAPDVCTGADMRILIEAADALASKDEEIRDLKQTIVAFCAPWAVAQAHNHGLPEGHLFPSHFDILERCGARMVAFTRHDFQGGSDVSR
ncbi:MAG TPA: hypothetical protein VIO94_16095 [Phenylobacterium sp.]